MSSRRAAVAGAARAPAAGKSWSVRLRRWRVARRLTQAQAGELVGVSRRTWGKWESGVAKPSRRHVSALEALLCVQEGAHSASDGTNGELPYPDPPPGKVHTMGTLQACLRPHRHDLHEATKALRDQVRVRRAREQSLERQVRELGGEPAA